VEVRFGVAERRPVDPFELGPAVKKRIVPSATPAPPTAKSTVEIVPERLAESRWLCSLGGHTF